MFKLSGISAISLLEGLGFRASGLKALAAGCSLCFMLNNVGVKISQPWDSQGSCGQKNQAKGGKLVLKIKF